MYHALTIAKYVINYTNRKGKPITNLKLQKILYFLQAQFLVSTGYACFIDRIEAWDIGPVVPTVHRHFSLYGASVIPPIKEKTPHINFPNEYISPKHKRIINGMLDHLADYSTTDLIKFTLCQDPWKVAYQSRYLSNEITCASLKDYFTEDE